MKIKAKYPKQNGWKYTWVKEIGKPYTVYKVVSGPADVDTDKSAHYIEIRKQLLSMIN